MAAPAAPLSLLRLAVVLVTAFLLVAPARSFSGTTMKLKSSSSPSSSTKKIKTQKCAYLDVADSSEAWKLGPALDILRAGGLGVVPTDTSYAFACMLNSRKGTERIFEVKHYVGQRKPLALLCRDLSQISHYTSGIDKNLFKTLKATLPGPYTYILPATHEVPRVLLEHRAHRKTWKRREVGVRIPDHPVLHEIMSELDGPLLCSSVPIKLSPDEEAQLSEEAEHDDEGDEWISSAKAVLSTDPRVIYDDWSHAVDFVIDSGPIMADGLTTVVNCVGQPAPEVVREGLGPSEALGY